jgi:2-keto-3-deoxy-L-rhamnonate aldolase RhmA
MTTNRVLRNIQAGVPSFGTYITIPSSASVEVAALAGFDFARMDQYHIGYNPETLESMIRTCYAHHITPWVRVRNDPWTIMTTLDFGAQIITVPNIGSAEQAKQAVSAAFYPPFGEREMSRPLRFRNLSASEYLDWASANIQVACQIEGADGLENHKEIVKVEGLSIVQTGRGDLSLALGVPGQDSHPKVLEAEERIVTAALEAGKQVSLLQALTDEGLERARKWIDQGVSIMTLSSDYQALLGSYKAGLGKLSAGVTK